MVRLLLVALLLGPPAVAAGSVAGPARETVCNIPVFRYALERWPAAPYDVVAVHRGSLSDAEIAALTVLRQSGANLEVDRINLAEPIAAPRKDLVRRLRLDAPGLVALYPGTQTEAWRGPLDTAAARALVDSPARREVARRILGGQSGVWILLESGEKGKDDAAEALLGKELRSLEQSLQLPAHHPDDPPLLSDLPVAVSFSILRLSRSDPAEQPLVSMLAKSELGLEGTVAFPVFGRGRALWGLAGAGLNAQTIAESGEFLTGACSCEAKEFNPGVDLLFAADWEAGLSAAPDVPGLPVPVLQPRPPEAAPPPGSGPEGAGLFLWIALLVAGALVAVSGRRILA